VKSATPVMTTSFRQHSIVAPLHSSMNTPSQAISTATPLQLRRSGRRLRQVGVGAGGGGWHAGVDQQAPGGGGRSWTVGGLPWDHGDVRAEPLTDAADHLAELADEVETRHTRVVLTRPGHADVVLLSADELTSLEETVALADDPDAQQDIADAETAYAAGDYLTGDELRVRYGLPPRVA